MGPEVGMRSKTRWEGTTSRCASGRLTLSEHHCCSYERSPKRHSCPMFCACPPLNVENASSSALLTAIIEGNIFDGPFANPTVLLLGRPTQALHLLHLRIASRAVRRDNGRQKQYRCGARWRTSNNEYGLNRRWTRNWTALGKALAEQRDQSRCRPR